MKISYYAALGAITIAILGGALYLAAQPRKRAVQTKSCETNLKIIGLAMMQYTRDYDEKYPLSASWADDLTPYISSNPIVKKKGRESLFHCPTTSSFYAYNRNLQAVNIAQILQISDEPFAIEVAAGQTKRNLSGAGELWPTTPIHEKAGTRGNHVLCTDGHVELRQNKPRFHAFAPYKPKFGEVLTEEMLRRRRQKSKPTAQLTPRAKTKAKP